MTTRMTAIIGLAAVFGVVAWAGAQNAPPGGGEQPDGPAGVAEDAPAAGELDPEVLAAGQAALAENFAEMAQLALRGERLGEPEFRQAAALLRAAANLKPGEPRFWRLLVEAELQLGNREGALSALQGYRKIAPDDRVAQIQVIELHASRMEAGDAALEYLRGLLAKESIAAEVRSHVAVQIARRMLGRGEESAAPPVLEQALELNPVNVAALDLKYELVWRGAAPPRRAEGLLALLRANPTRPAVMAELARLLAGAGMGKESLEWFDRAVNLYGFVGAPDRITYHDLVVDYAAQLYLGGQFQAARGITEQLLKADPGDIDAWLLRLVIERGAAAEDQPGEAYANAREAAEAQLWQRWGAVAREIMDENSEPAEGAGAGEAAEGRQGQAPAEAAVEDAQGQGADEEEQDPIGAKPAQFDFPEPATVAEHVKASGDEGKQALFVSAAADFAWFELYFNEEPGAAGTWIDALETVLPEDSVTLVRLRGWLQIANKQHDEAAQTLGPARDTDPLSALGLVRLAAIAAGGARDAGRAVDEQARRLLASRPAGLVGAILSEELEDRGLEPEPRPEAAAIRQQLQKFPRAWLDIVDEPHRFYAVRVEPLRVAHAFGEPMIVRVTLQNLTEFDLAIGDEGVIRPALWFDAHVQAMRGEPAPGTAVERLGQATVLPARQTIAQYARVDQGRLAEILTANPSPQLQITGWCMTNPMQHEDGFGPGPAGLRVPFAKKMVRTGFPINRPGALEELVRGAEAGLPETKVRSLNLIGVLVPLLRQDDAPATRPGQRAADEGGAEEPAGESAPRAKAAAVAAAEAAERGARVAAKLVDVLTERTADEMPAVAQWARFELAHVGEPEQQAEAIESLLADPRWEGRLLGLIASPKLGAARAEDLAANFADAEEEEPWVSDYAAALVEVLQRPAPASQPAEETDDGAGESAPE